MSAVITLITDTGDIDYYIGSVKGAILSECPGAQIIEISKSVKPFHIDEAAYLLKNSWLHFPKGTAHIVLVENRTVTARRILISEHEGHFFVAPDNGIFSLLFEDRNLKIFELDKKIINPENLPMPSRIIMAKAAARLVTGFHIGDLGHLKVDIFRKLEKSPVITDNAIRGSVVYIDAYHNVITNIRKDLFEKQVQQKNFSIALKRLRRIREIGYVPELYGDGRADHISEINNDYSDVSEGEKLCLFNSNGYLVIAINKGNAAGLLGLDLDSIVQVEILE